MRFATRGGNALNPRHCVWARQPETIKGFGRMPDVGGVLHIAVYVLAGIAAIEAVALVVLSRLLVGSRREPPLSVSSSPDANRPQARQPPPAQRPRHARRGGHSG